MKCKFCGAEIKEGNRVCDYCGSAVENISFENQNGTRNTKNIFKGIARVIIILASIWAVVLILTTFIVLNSKTFKDSHAYFTTAQHPEMPRNKTELTGQIINCSEKGIVSLECEDQIYEDIRITDEDLINWLNETDRSLDTVGICFSTDENGNINDLGLLSADFFVMEQSEDLYTAARSEEIISFSSPVPLETGCCYSGYFSYPDMRLYFGEKKDLLPFYYIDPKCTDKESTIEQDYYTGKDITVYKIHALEQWYYCSKEIYDSIQTGDILNDYSLYNHSGLNYITKK